MVNKALKLISKIVILIIVCVIIFSLSTVYAQGGINVNDYNPGGTPSIPTEVTDKINPIVGVISLIGMITSVLVLVILGIKYMIGSVEEKAEYKKSMIPYLIGAVMVFSISTFLTIIMNMTNNLFTTTPWKYKKNVVY